ncbi:MAG TPA: pyridine nucleotide-disulfide oxidoreductase, partial [Thermoanaerobaculia bacterium]|nr:pyridine nucleotide-disulfide oxidoreductase [Thermoanaerobaculia bacterium]
MNLGIESFTYADLQSHDGLNRLATAFDRHVEEHDAELFRRFESYRRAPAELPAPEESALLIAVGRHLSQFIARLFHVEAQLTAQQQRALRDAEVARFKREFVAKRVAKVAAVADAPEGERLIAAIAPANTDPELALAITANRLLDLEKEYPRGAKELSPSAKAREEVSQLREHLGVRRERVLSPEALPREAAALHELTDSLVNWIAARWKEGRFDGWTSFRLPRPLVFDKLVPIEPVDELRFGGKHHEFRRRDAFHLTDNRMTPRQVADEAHYCIYCHERKKDSCSKGFLQPNNTYKPNPLGMALEGCPLDEKIGEMNFLRADGDAIGALAIVMIDNPMCPGTGHRICNDCMRSCIFQKQDPVNIPQIETGALTDVLFLPYGFEIYALLTLWNPLNVRRPVALPYNGKNVLVVGLGPAGYTLAHYLANEGFGVVAIDGLKIEPSGGGGGG